MKKVLCLVLIAVFVMGSILPLYGASQKTITLSIGSAKCMVDGQEKWMDVAPFVQDGRTYVPIRFISEALGATVDYTKYADGSAKDVTITLDETTAQSQPQVDPAQREQYRTDVTKWSEKCAEHIKMATECLKTPSALIVVIKMLLTDQQEFMALEAPEPLIVYRDEVDSGMSKILVSCLFALSGDFSNSDLLTKGTDQMMAGLKVIMLSQGE